LSEEGFPCLRYGEIYSTYGNTTACLRSRVSPKAAASAQVLKTGDIVFAASGETLSEIGKAIAYIGSEPAYVGGDTIILREHHQDSVFLAHALNSEQAIRQKARLGKGQSVVHIHAPDLSGLEIYLPHLSEQRKVAKILRTWDEALEKLTALRAAKERRFVAIAQRLLAPSRAIGRHIPPSNWKLTSFGEVFEERKDRNTALEADDAVTVGKYAIRKQSEHFSRSVASKDLSNYWVISPGDFVYDPMSAYYGALGRYTGRGDGIVSPAYRVIRLKSGINPDFMVHILRSHAIRFLLETRSSQGNKEGKRRLLSRDEFGSVEFNLPEIKVQEEIAGKLSLAEQDLALTTAEIEALTRQKRGLMQKLLTGEWPVKFDGVKGVEA